jgi:hypothetical protein
MLPIKNPIELVVKSLGRGLFVLKLTGIQARSQVPRSLSVAVPPAKPSYSLAWSPSQQIVTAKANGSHAAALIFPAKGHYPATLQECLSERSRLMGRRQRDLEFRRGSAARTACALAGITHEE